MPKENEALNIPEELTQPDLMAHLISRTENASKPTDSQNDDAWNGWPLDD